MVKHFDANLLPQIVDVWCGNKIFSEKRDLIARSVERYKNEDYISCMSILTPQIEGLLRDMLLVKKDLSMRITPKKSFKELKFLFKSKNKLKIFDITIESFSKYFNQTKGIFVNFEEWTDSLSEPFLSRHAQLHGKYDKKMYSSLFPFCPCFCSPSTEILLERRI